MKNRPRLLPHLIPVWDAFWELHTCRPAGFAGYGPIPWTAIREWAREHEVSDPAHFERLIRRLDIAFLNARREQREKERDEEKRKEQREKMAARTRRKR